jgi:hypothetical protein
VTAAQVTRCIALGRRRTDTSDTANACASAREGASRNLVAELLGAPAAELDLGKTVVEASYARPAGPGERISRIACAKTLLALVVR